MKLFYYLKFFLSLSEYEIYLMSDKSNHLNHGLKEERISESNEQFEGKETQ